MSDRQPPQILKQPPTYQEVNRIVRKLITAVKAKGPTASLDAYAGDNYFIADWEDAETSFERAVQEVQDPFTLFLILSLKNMGLEHILADRYATAGLKKCLIEKNPGVRRALAAYATDKKRGKPGPRPKDGRYKGDRALELRLEGKTLGQIARELYGDPKKANVVSANLARVKKKGKNPPTD
jgi:hypothetical protein